MAPTFSTELQRSEIARAYLLASGLFFKRLPSSSDHTAEDRSAPRINHNYLVAMLLTGERRGIFLRHVLLYRRPARVSKSKVTTSVPRV